MKLIVFGDYHFVADKNYSDQTPYFEYSQAFIDLKNDFHKFGISSIFEEEADLYISLGDLTNFGREDEIQKVYQLIKETGKYDKFIHVFGNHDLYSSSAKEMSDLTGQAYNYSIDTDHARLIFFASPKDKDPVEWGGVLTEEDEDFLRQEIQEAQGKPIIIFSHHPVYDTVRKTRLEKHYIEPRDKMRAILDRHSGKGIFVAGHTHAESIASDDKWTYVNLDAFLDHPKYSIMKIGDQGIRLTSKEIDLSEDMDAKRLAVGTHMPHFLLRPEDIGTSLDREKFIKF